MSGGGGGGGPPAGPPPGGPTPCDRLVFQTRLTNPPPPAFATISVAQRLLVDLENMGGVHVITARDTTGNLIGAITSQVPDLIRCIQQGFRFEAEITGIARPAIDVTVRPG